MSSNPPSETKDGNNNCDSKNNKINTNGKIKIKMEEYQSLRNKDCKYKILTPSLRLFENADYCIINIEERYRYIPLKVKVHLNNKSPPLKRSKEHKENKKIKEHKENKENKLIDATNATNTIMPVDYFKFSDMINYNKIMKALKALKPSEEDQEVIYELYDKFSSKIQEVYMNSFNYNYSDPEVSKFHGEHGYITVDHLLILIRSLLEMIYPVDEMGDMGVTSEIEIEGNVVSFNMD